MRTLVKRIPSVFALLVVMAVMGLAPDLQACSCARLGPACEMAWNSDSVFVGRVVRISDQFVRTSDGTERQKRVTFQVSETFRGPVKQTVDVTTDVEAGGDCGFPFERGRDYLVYASRSEGVLYTSICSRTARAEGAASDLAYLRSFAKGETPSKIFGSVTEFNPRPVPIAKVPIRLVSPTSNRETITDSAGQYSFDALPPGTFTISASLPNNWGGGEGRTVRLVDNACSEQNFFAVERAQLPGQLFDADGQSWARASVAMIPLSASNRSQALEGLTGFTGGAGRFAIQRLPPGDYLLVANSEGFPTTYFPGVQEREKATVIHVESGQQLTPC